MSEHLLAYLKHEFVGSRRDCIKVVEYQRGGLPQAHIVLAIESPPGTAREVNNIVIVQDTQLQLPMGAASHAWFDMKCGLEKVDSADSRSNIQQQQQYLSQH